MGKRTVGFIVAIGVGCLLYLGYVHYRDNRADTADTRGDRSSSERTATAPNPASQPSHAIAQPVPLQTNASAPTADSIAPNPVNGMAFAGSGKFQLYRQGNLTWRLDTETGRSCILFATMEEWKKPIVYTTAATARPFLIAGEWSAPDTACAFAFVTGGDSAQACHFHGLPEAYPGHAISIRYAHRLQWRELAHRLNPRMEFLPFQTNEAL